MGWGVGMEDEVGVEDGMGWGMCGGGMEGGMR